MPFRLILPQILSKAHDCTPLFGSFLPRLKKKYHALIFKSDTSKILIYPVADGQSVPPSAVNHLRSILNVLKFSLFLKFYDLALKFRTQA